MPYQNKSGWVSSSEQALWIVQPTTSPIAPPRTACASVEYLYDEDEKIGMNILAKALRSPARTIANNAGADGDVIVSQIMEKSGAYGYDARKGEFTDLVKAGIVDAAKVARIALENAASVAGLMLTTEVLLTELKDEDKEKQIAHAVR